MLNLGKILPINNWHMAHNMILQRSWPWKVKVIGQNKWHHKIPWPQKHVSRCQNHHSKCLSLKVMAKDVFLHNGGHCNAFGYVSCSNHSRCFWFVKRPRPKLPSLKIWWQFVQQEPRYGPKCDFIQLWPWKVKVERSRSSVRSIIFCSAIRTLLMSIHVKFHWHPTGSFSGKLAHN